MPAAEKFHRRTVVLSESIYERELKADLARYLSRYKGLLVTPEIIEILLCGVADPPSKATLRKWLKELGCRAIKRGIYQVPL